MDIFGKLIDLTFGKLIALVLGRRAEKREDRAREIAERGPDCDRIEAFAELMVSDTAHWMVQAGLPKANRTSTLLVDEAQRRMQVVADSWNAVTSLDPSGDLFRLCGEAYQGMSSLGTKVLDAGDDPPDLDDLDRHREFVGRRVVEIRKIVSEYRLGKR